VDDALLVRCDEGLGECRCYREDLLDGEPALGDEPVERLALDELHRQEVNAVRLLDGVDGDDAGVVERGERFRFTPGSARAAPGFRPSPLAAP